MMEARWSVRSVAVLVGLSNLVVLAHFFGGSPALPTGIAWQTVTVSQALPYVLAAVASGLVTAEVAVRRFDRLSAAGRYASFEKLSRLNAGIAGAVCLGGALMGLLISAVFVLRVSPNIAVGLPLTGFYGVLFGGVLGAIEGLLLAPPLAAVLKRSGGDRRSPTTPA